jgi:hypothetical protein
MVKPIEPFDSQPLPPVPEPPFEERYQQLMLTFSALHQEVTNLRSLYENLQEKVRNLSQQDQEEIHPGRVIPASTTDQPM